MIDIGVNLINKQFKSDKDIVIKRAKENGISNIILTGTSLSNSKLSNELCNKYDGYLYSTAGVHPHNAKEYTDLVHKELLNLLKNDNVISVGECGLDFDRNFSSKDEQYNAFENQLELSRVTGKPLFLHEREAHNEFLSVMRNNKDLINNSVVHCFTSNKYHLQTYVNMGFMIGITGWICDLKRGKELREALKYLPLDRLMIETDSPFLTPKNIKGIDRRNEPSNLIYIGKEISKLMNIEEALFFEIVENNTRKFFNI